MHRSGRPVPVGGRRRLVPLSSTTSSWKRPRPVRTILADHIEAVAAVLASHAHLEDLVIDPVLERYQPALAEKITGDPDSLDGRYASCSTSPASRSTARPGTIAV